MRKNDQASAPQDVERAVSAFFAVRNLVRKQLAQKKRLSLSAWLRVEALKFVADTDGARLTDVAHYFSITAPSATSLVSSLERAHLLERARDARDRRTIRLTLTARGRRELKKALARGLALLGQLFGSLSAEELSAFTNALESIRNRSRRVVH